MVDRNMAKAMLAVWHGYGIEFDKMPNIDMSQLQIFYISVPSSSELINKFGEEMSGKKLAQRFNTALNSMGGYSFKVKYKIRDEHWTKELRDLAYDYFLSL